MECQLNCENPDEILYTIKMTATAKEWDKFRSIITSKEITLPFQMQQSIISMLTQANKTYRGEE